MITIVAVGKKHESWVEEGIRRYETRLRAPFDTKWWLIPHSSLKGQRAREEESERILSRIKPEDVVILLDEVGVEVDSPALSRRLENLLSAGKSPVIVVGGAYGVSGALQRRADFVWSLSPLVFPHQLVRLILIEQLYRAQSIANGSKYHHN